MYFSKEIIKKDIPLFLQSYFLGKYFDRCGSVHLGARGSEHRCSAEIDQGSFFFSPCILQMVDCGGMNVKHFLCHCQKSSFLVKNGLII